MTRIAIFGASDDLIEVCRVTNPAAPLSFQSIAEYQAIETASDAPFRLKLTDGTLLALWYDAEGIWRIKVEHRGAAATVIVPAEGDEWIYTDVAVVTLPGQYVGPDVFEFRGRVVHL
ncbi:MAG: hypothetical protein WC138_13690 [Methanoculleus sp.]